VLLLVSAGALVMKYSTGRLTDPSGSAAYAQPESVARPLAATPPTEPPPSTVPAVTPPPQAGPAEMEGLDAQASLGTAGMKPAAALAFLHARAAARRAGISLRFVSGYRSPAEQLRLYRQALRTYGSPQRAQIWVLPPSKSTHVLGIAMDVAPRSGAAWLAAHGARYDLCQAYANEWWHFEYRPAWVDHGRCSAPLPSPLAMRF
jgi:hypothetical protein